MSYWVKQLVRDGSEAMLRAQPPILGPTLRSGRGLLRTGQAGPEPFTLLPLPQVIIGPRMPHPSPPCSPSHFLLWVSGHCRHRLPDAMLHSSMGGRAGTGACSGQDLPPWEKQGGRWCGQLGFRTLQLQKQKSPAGAWHSPASGCPHSLLMHCPSYLLLQHCRR